MKKMRDFPVINASSMADIAFLLLIFFLVTTTIDMDKGIIVKLPQWDKDPIIKTQMHEKNVLEIWINANEELLVEGSMVDIKDLASEAIQFLDNNGSKQCTYCKGLNNTKSSYHPQKAVISLKSHRSTSYDFYIQVYDQLIHAYYTLRDDVALDKYQITYKELNKEKKETIEKLYPMLLSEAEPF